MKLSSNTLEILKNFSGIYNSIYFQDGTEQRVYPMTKSVLALAKIEESFPKKFAIADLKQFLSLISIMKDPELQFEDNYVFIKSANQKIKYRYSNPTLVHHIDREIKLPEVYEKFEITAEILTKFSQAGALLSTELVALVGDGSNLFIQTFDEKDEERSSASFELSKTDKKFRAVLKYDVLCNKMLSDDYEVIIGKNKLSAFISKNRELKYFIPCEAKTTELE